MTTKFFVPRADRRLGDRYELIECLGDGSYGWVWKARRVEDGAIVALKIPKAQGKGDDELSEGEALVGRAPHESVIAIHWMGRVPPEREWFVIEMEYFPSMTLARLLERNDDGFVASYGRLLDVFEQVLAGCAHLHRLGMSHGDIKPQNILVSGDRVKLTDFGSSLLPEDMYARTRENGCTVLYSAPESAGTSLAARDLSARFKGDVYSLGVLLYHLVTARLPHDTLSQVVRHVPFPPAREINSSVCEPLDAFVDRCLAAQPGDRWPDVETMLGEFRRVKRAQLEFTPTRAAPLPRPPHEDWSTQALRFLEHGAYADAENVARAEHESSRDPGALLLVITAAFRGGRHHACVRELESPAGRAALASPTPSGAQLRRVALDAYLALERVQPALDLVDRCLADAPGSPALLLRKASLLAMDAQYEPAAQQLLDVNRRLPGRPAVLRRLVMVHEQLRDSGKAAAFLRAYQKAVPNDAWAESKAEQYRALRL